MTTLVAQLRRPQLAARSAEGVLVPTIGLLALAGLRGAATSAGLDALTVGIAFGAGFAVVAVALGLRLGRPAATSVALGLVTGLALVGLALATRPAPHLWAPAAAFGPWVGATILVAAMEEANLRGVIFDRLQTRRGGLVALVASAGLFGAIHVPVYGWQVLPLDLGVGLLLGGLRLVTGGLAAPIVAHVVADIATWWL